MASASLALMLLGSGCSSDPGSAGDASSTVPDQQTSDAHAADASATDLAGPTDGAKALDRATADQPSSSFPYYAINHVLCTGQSLSVGSMGYPALSTTQPYSNVMFNTGPVSSLTFVTPTAFKPLIEVYVSAAHPDAGPQETLSSGMANLVTKLAREEVFPDLPAPRNSHDLLVSCHGVGGTPYSGLKKGTTPYRNGMEQVKAGMALATQQKLSYVVRAVTIVHGESDDCLGTGCDYNPDYAENLVSWQEDYESDVKAITGQTAPVPMFQSQISSWTRMAKRATSHTPNLQLQASLSAPGKIIMVCPKYFLPYSDGVHLTNVGYRWLGEYYAKAYRRVVLEEGDFQPLRPLAAKLSGTKITVTFHVPVPPLVLDTTLVSKATNYGFEYSDSSGSPPSITAVSLSGPTTATISLSKAPSASASKNLFYAFTGQANALAGPQSGPRGNLRDSDATPSRNGKTLYNWAVHFSQAVHY